jgi:nondiscriminating glutamyl-tRNA synthetase
MNQIRVRMAPSPTGFVHIGNLRTILYIYLFAKHNKGSFIIRIEDTDQTRLVPGAVENLLKVLRWAGLEPDEGPAFTSDDKVKEKGDFGPYTQSQRLDIYDQQIQDLLDKNKAYPCFCSKERLDKVREDQSKNKQAPKYDGFCRNLAKDEVNALMDSGKPYVIRFKMPENKEVVFNDIIRGAITVNTKNLDDYVLIKSDKFPTYHFACVVDDHFMKISHVLRGEEWIASTPKHILLYEAFGWQMPEFAHLPQLLNKQKKKLSKRDGDSTVSDFIDSGYLKDALLNFIALLGWNAGTEQEIYTLDELEKQFSLDGVHKAGAIFDLDKLDWINGQYIRELSDDEFFKICLPYLEKSDLVTFKSKDILVKQTGETIKETELKKLLNLEKSRVKKLKDVPDAIIPYLLNDIEYEPKDLIWKKSDQSATVENLKTLENELKSIKPENFIEMEIEKHVLAYIESNNLDTGSMLWPMRFALSGRSKSPGPFELASALGKEKTLARLNSAIARLL